jgi:hypothetical protein
VQQSPECKAFVLAKQTVIDASTVQAPLQCVTMDGTAHLFKKQRLWLNPTFSTQQQYTHHPLSHSGTEDEFMDAENDNVSLTDNNASLSRSITSDNFVATNESFVYEDFVENNDFADTNEVPVESDYACFTINQQCITSLMYLLDSMECPDYAFQEIMEWARKSYEAGFDFNPKCKTCLGNLTWMYNALHNAEQMLPHLEPVELPDPLPNVTTMNVICYDFVPQVLSILQDKKMMSANNLVLDPPNSPPFGNVQAT